MINSSKEARCEHRDDQHSWFQLPEVKVEGFHKCQIWNPIEAVCAGCGITLGAELEIKTKEVERLLKEREKDVRIQALMACQEKLSQERQRSKKLEEALQKIRKFKATTKNWSTAPWAYYAKEALKSSKKENKK